MTTDAAPEEVIDCIDCGGPSRLQVTWAPDNPPVPGDIVTYRCRDCLDLWYLVIPDPED